MEDKRNIGSLGRKCKPEKVVEDSRKILGKNVRYLADSWNYNGDTGTWKILGNNGRYLEYSRKEWMILVIKGRYLEDSRKYRKIPGRLLEIYWKIPGRGEDKLLAISSSSRLLLHSSNSSTACICLWLEKS